MFHSFPCMVSYAHVGTYVTYSCCCNVTSSTIPRFPTTTTIMSGVTMTRRRPELLGGCNIDCYFEAGGCIYSSPVLPTTFLSSLSPSPFPSLLPPPPSPISPDLQLDQISTHQSFTSALLHRLANYCAGPRW